MVNFRGWRGRSGRYENAKINLSCRAESAVATILRPWSWHRKKSRSQEASASIEHRVVLRAREGDETIARGTGTRTREVNEAMGTGKKHRKGAEALRQNGIMARIPKHTVRT